LIDGSRQPILSVSRYLWTISTIRATTARSTSFQLLPDDPLDREWRNWRVCAARHVRAPYDVRSEWLVRCLTARGEMPLDSSLWGSENVSTQDLMALMSSFRTTTLRSRILGRGWHRPCPGTRENCSRTFGPMDGGQDQLMVRHLRDFKPDREHRMAENEVTVSQLAANCGLTVPDVELLDLNGTKILAIRRYDRTEVDRQSHAFTKRTDVKTGTPPMQKSNTQADHR